MFSLFIEINVEADGLTVSNLRIAQELNATESYEVKSCSGSGKLTPSIMN